MESSNTLSENGIDCVQYKLIAEQNYTMSFTKLKPYQISTVYVALLM